jgi:hypothetical protein
MLWSEQSKDITPGRGTHLAIEAGALLHCRKIELSVISSLFHAQRERPWPCAVECHVCRYEFLASIVFAANLTFLSEESQFADFCIEERETPL